MWEGFSRGAKVKLTFLFFFATFAACGVIIPQPGIEPTLPAPKARSLEHWTAREFPTLRV